MRNKQGYSIILVSSLGLILVMTALAVTSGLIPVYKNIGAQNMQVQAQEAAEMGIQYAVAQLNAAASPDDITPQSPQTQAVNGATVTITITLADLATMQAYVGSDATMTAFLNDPKNKTALPLDFRVIKSQAAIGLNKATIYCVVGSQPIINPTANSLSTPSSTYFNNALFGGSGLAVQSTGRPLRIMSETGMLKAQISSNQLVTLSGDVTVDGNVYANNTSNKSPSIVGSNSNKINGNLYYNGNINNTGFPPPFVTDNSFTRNSFFRPYINVFGDGSVGGASGSLNVQNVSNPAAPAGLADVGQTTYLGDLHVAAGESYKLTPGNYVASSINVDPGGTLEIAQPDGPPIPGQLDGVIVNINNRNSNGNAVTMLGDVTNSLGSQNFQMFYEGNNPVNLTMNKANFYGLIYAPNSNVTLNISGQEFHGAIAGNNVTVSGYGTVKYDPTSTGSGGGPSSDPTSNTTNSLYYVKATQTSRHYVPLTWYEAAG